MHQPTRLAVLAVLAVIAALVGVTPAAHAQVRSRRASVSAIGRAIAGPRSPRGRGPRWGQWDDAYGGAGTSFVGGRRDDRWRWYDGARAPGWSGGLHRYDGPPYDRPQW